jgi:riboflavin synthase
MFTGIITDVGEVVSLEAREGWTRLLISAPVTAGKVMIGSSVAVCGVCLTVNTIENGTMEFSLLPQTLAITNIGLWSTGTPVNLECALRVGDELGGHFVYGHVDGVGEIFGIDFEGECIRMRIKLSKDLIKFVASKGSIALDGVSLTVAAHEKDFVEVALVEYTLECL